MKHYDEYKQTGTPWIGEIPSHWEVMKISHLFNLIGSGTTPNTGDSSYYSDETEHFWLQTGDLNDGYIHNTSKKITKKAIKELNLKVYRKGSLVIAMYGATVGKLGLLNIDTSVNQACCVISNSKRMKNLFLYYTLFSARKYLISLSVGGGQPNISQEIIKKHKIPVPPIVEQEAIAAYLDKKCGSIDAVIATQERRIALLEELKQSVITEAVTHGINPDAKLRPSGIDWIGNIPDHWQTMPLKYTANKKGCCFIDGDWIESKDIVEEGIKYITTGNIGALTYKEQGSGYISEKTFAALGCTEVFEGDILISRLNEPIGRCCIIPDLGNRIVTSVDNVIFRPDTDKYNKKFIVYYLNSNKFTEHANLIARGATMHRISRTMLGHQQVLVPPLTEQEEIVKYIESKIKPIDASIAKAKREIELLKELKQSVITEAVAGKIKVC